MKELPDSVSGLLEMYHDADQETRRAIRLKIQLIESESPPAVREEPKSRWPDRKTAAAGKDD